MTDLQFGHGKIEPAWWVLQNRTRHVFSDGIWSVLWAELDMVKCRFSAVTIMVGCVALTSAQAAEYAWGGAGSRASTISWDDTADDGNGVNADADHWGNAIAPNLNGTDSVVIPSGGVTKSAVLVEGPSTFTIAGGYFYTVGFDVGKNTTGAAFTLDGGEVNCQWFSVYAGSTGQIVSGSINLRGGNEPMPPRNGGYLNFTGTSGTLTMPGKSSGFIESKILAGVIRIDGVVLSTVDEIVNDRYFVVNAIMLQLIEQSAYAAFGPAPDDDADLVDVDRTLAWNLPQGVTACDVYFGTDSGVENNPKVVSNALETSYRPAADLEHDTKYYWRVDTYAGGSWHTGQVWDFTTVTAITNTLVAHWDLEEGSGPTTTAAVGSPTADGTLSGATWTGTDLGPVPTGTTAAVDFDATAGDYIQTGFAGISGTRARTVSAWIKGDVVQSENATFVSWGSSSNSMRYSFRLNTTSSNGTVGALRLEIQGSYAIAQTALNDGQWHHVAVLHEAGAGIWDVLFYIDGALEAGLSGKGSTNAAITTGTNSPVMIGNSFHNTSSYGFDGAVDDIRIYDYALSAYEIEDLYIGTIPRAVEPTPAPAAEHVGTTATLEWEVINASAPTFDINIGTDSDCNDVLVGQSTGSTRNYSVPEGLLDYGTTYYWCVDVTDDVREYPGYVWFFTTGGKATDPVPADGSTAKGGQRQLSWTGDAMVASCDVYFGTSEPLHYVGNYTQTAVGFEYLAAALSLVRLPGGATYSWRVDCLDAQDGLMTTGDTWTFSLSESEALEYGILDDFDGYADDAELTAAWIATIGASVVLEELTNIMEYSYDCTAFPYECTVQRTFTPAANWNYDGFKSLQINFRGDEQNVPEIMYITLSDGTDTVKVVHDNPNVLTDYQWQTWDIALSAFSGVDMDHVTSVRIGFGDGGSPGGAGLVRFNDMLLYPGRCLEEFAAHGDLNLDCAIDAIDLGLFAGGWLNADYVVTAQEPRASGLRAYYRFDETNGVVAGDSSGLGHDAAISPPDATGMWDGDGHSGGCIKLDDSFDVSIPAGVFATTDEAVSVAFWVNGRTEDFPSEVSSASFAAGQAPIEDNRWDRLVWDIGDASSYAGGWNHYAFVKDSGTGVMDTYHNGLLVGRNDAALAPLSGASAGASLLHARFANSSSVRMDDLVIYDYALDQSEVVYLAAGEGAQLTQPVYPVLSRADVNGDGRVDLQDFAALMQGWLSEYLWPQP